MMGKFTFNGLLFLTLVLSPGLRGAEDKVSPAVLDYYDLETIKLPDGEASVDAIAFLPDGRLACALSHSKIYFYNPETNDWKLFAEGLHTPLGLLALDNNEILVAQRPEITLLSDRNGDGRAEHFKTVSDAFGLSGNYAEFNFGPVKDSQGNLFFSLGTGSNGGSLLGDEVRGLYSRAGHDGRMNSSVPYRGWIMKITPDGQTLPWANGFREPNGLGFDTKGNLFVPDNQGDFVGSSKLFHVRRNGFYGHPHSLVWRAEINRHPFDIPVAELDRMRSRAAVVFPHGEMANSPSQPLCDTSGGRFGPFAGQMFIGEMNYSRLIRLMLEEVDGEFQGACIPFFDHAGLNLGNNRLAFSPKDGSLWIGQTKYQFWVGASGLQRLVWKGVTPMEVKSMRLTKSGFDLTFTRPVDRNTAANPDNFTFESYHFNYHEKYGSEKFELSKEKVIATRVSKDQHTVSLVLDGLKPWKLYDLKIKEVTSKEGHPLLNPWMVYTLNRLLENTPPPPPPVEMAAPKRKEPAVPKTGVKSIGGPQEFASTATPSGVKIHRIEGGFRFLEDGKDILVYRKDPVARDDGKYKRGHYIHPLYDLDGVLMTHDMPKDHPHHRGVFWAWTQLWIDKLRIGHPWEQRDLTWDVRDVRIVGDASSSAIETDVLWKSPLWVDKEGRQTPIVEEHSVIRVHEATKTERMIDFEIRLRALEEKVRLGGSTDAKGYGGFAARIPLPKDLEINGPDGRVAVDTSKPSPPQAWVDFSADFGTKGKVSGLAILCHPSLPGFPQGWTIRTANSCQNPVFPGQEPITLPTTKTLVLRYRIILHRGNMGDANIAQFFKNYSRLE
jgi:glucose/arabinose dehydrogenase